MSKTTLAELTSKSDHDILVIIKTRVDDLTTTIIELKNGVQAQLTDHESRIRFIERLIDQVNPTEQISQGKIFQKEFYAVRDKIDDFFSRWKVYAAFGLFLAGITGGMIQWLLTNIIIRH